MCGRFVRATPPDALARYFGATLGESLLEPSWNVAPTNDIYAVVLGHDGARHLEAFHWGLVPVWAKDVATGYKLINARAESVATSGAFKAAFRRRRCLVPVDGFYEWKALPAGQLPLGELGSPKGTKPRKQPMYIRRADGEPLAFAGLWEVWRGPKGQPLELPLHSATIITTNANETMAPIHDRMPAILPASAWAAWLDPTNDDLDGLGGLLVPAPAGLLVATAVGTGVNNVRNKGPELVAPVGAGD